jgi:hypothetical protein
LKVKIAGVCSIEAIKASKMPDVAELPDDFNPDSKIEH